jgi:hypothetical protein
MALAGLDELDLSWTLRNTLTINNDVTVEGDVNTTGAIYDGGIPITITGDNNVWTGNNLFKNFQPTFLAPVQPEDMATKDYMVTAFTGAGTALLPLNNNWTGFNNMSNGTLPTITNQATPGTNEMVNLNTLNAYLATQTGQLNTANTWTRQNTFTNKVNVPNPLTLAQFGNKTYVDAEIAAYNAAGGNIEYVEILAQSGITNITLDPAVYTGMYVCMVGGGGFGVAAGAPVVPGTITYGGSGGYAAFKISSFTGVATYSITAATPVDLGTSSFIKPGGVPLVSVSSGQTPIDSLSNGAGGTVTLFNGMTNVQTIQGTTGIPNTDTTSLVQYTFNIGCLNGYGQGGSFNNTSSVSVAPTGLYCLLIKFKK